jgi:cell division protein FtsI/penicillin-binding protein 2
MALIIVRCWHLAVIQHESRVEEAKKPQKRILIEPAKRATIRDRFNIPLAVNKIQYQAAILYSQMKPIPSVSWGIDENGKKIKIFKKREYISKLSQLLANELNMDADRLEDLIYKASLYNHVPFVIKEDLSEKEYYRLKMLEKDWLGLLVRHSPKRVYPKEKVAADIIGFMGAINHEEYEAIVQEINALSECLEEDEKGNNPELPKGMESIEQVSTRLQDLKEKAYTINDYVGKSGIEGRFEEDLRGFHGKKAFYSDARGNFLKELPNSRDPLSGQRLLLSISSELQEFAEELLIKNENVRHTRVSEAQEGTVTKEPWIKGGAIVAMDPHTGEILALASYPRFNPNDFVPSGDPDTNQNKKANIRRWFETDDYIMEIWEQKRPLKREAFDKKYGIYEEKRMMTWDHYLEFVLNKKNPILQTFKNFNRVEHTVIVQKTVDELMSICGTNNLYAIFNELYQGNNHEQYGKNLGANAKQNLLASIKKNQAKIKTLKTQLDTHLAIIPHNYDKVLYIDLCRLSAPGHLFSKQLLKKTGQQSLDSYKETTAAMATIKPVVKEMTRKLFHDITFKEWRKNNQQAFLKEKRALEKAEKKYAKPYLDYMDQQENEMFNALWKRHQWQLLTTFLIGDWLESHPDEQIASYIEYFLERHDELSQASKQQQQPWHLQYLRLQTALKGQDLETALEYLQTLRNFSELDRPLLGKYRQLRHEKDNKTQLEKHLAAAFYPIHGFGYARSLAYRHAATLGSIFKIVTAYEALVQRYKKLNNPYITVEKLNPLTIEDAVFSVGKDQYVGYHDNGKPIPRFYKGGLMPRSLSKNNGKIDIIKAIERSSNSYFALLSGDFLSEPEDLASAAKLFSYGAKTGINLPAEIPGKVPDDLKENKTGLYSLSIGQHTLVVTPLQTAVMLSAIANGGHVLEPKLINFSVGPAQNRNNRNIKRFHTKTKHSLFMPDQVRRILLEGMSHVVERSQQVALGSLQNLYHQFPEAVRDFIELKGQLIGKTSTAESIENIDLDIINGTNKYNHLWFGGISFNPPAGATDAFILKNKFGSPELVVVVYLRYGAYGKDTEPVAAQVIKKWRQIKAKES